jgi:hypothetical protein
MSTARERRFLTVMLIITGLISAALGAAHVGGSVRHAFHVCSAREAPPDVARLEGPIFRESMALVPLGVVCEWKLQDGSVLYGPNPDLSESFALYGGGAAALVGFIMLARLRRRS